MKVSELMKAKSVSLATAGMAVLALSACGGGSGAAQASFGPEQPNAAAPASADSNPSGASGCGSGDPAFLCLGVKVVSYSDSGGKAVLSREEADKLFQQVNALWATCKIGFQIDEYRVEDPAAQGLTFGAASQSETTQIRQKFSNSSTLLYAATGAWDTATIAWTEMPGSGPYGAIVDSNYATHDVTVAHEFGHYLGLDHHQDTANMMYYIVYDSARAISAEQCAKAQQTIHDYWPSMLR